MTAMSCAKCRPSQFFLYLLLGALPSPGLHLLSVHSPDSQSALVSQLGGVSQVPSLPHAKPCLHSVEFSHGSPQALCPCTVPEQPGKSGGHSSFATQRAGGASPG